MSSLDASQSSPSVLKVERDGAIVTLTIDDQPTRNALSLALTREPPGGA